MKQKPYRQNKVLAKMRAMQVRFDRLLISPITRGGKTHLRAARKELAAAIRLEEKALREKRKAAQEAQREGGASREGK